MPILPSEPNIFPADLLHREPAPDGDGRWHAVYTKPRQEKSLARDLLAREIPFYLPLVTKQSRSKGRTLKSLTPLFSGYVFLFADEEQRVQALKTNRISRTVDVDDGQLLRTELQSLQRLIITDAPVTIERKLEAGRAVCIKSGPMAGTEGVVISRRGKDLLLVAVTLLQQGVSVEIDDFQVEPIY